jgi:hypothetical protein
MFLGLMGLRTSMDLRNAITYLETLHDSKEKPGHTKKRALVFEERVLHRSEIRGYNSVRYMRVRKEPKNVTRFTSVESPPRGARTFC